jgi:hypothetical protein
VNIKKKKKNDEEEEYKPEDSNKESLETSDSDSSDSGHELPKPTWKSMSNAIFVVRYTYFLQLNHNIN